MPMTTYYFLNHNSTPVSTQSPTFIIISCVLSFLIAVILAIILFKVIFVIMDKWFFNENEDEKKGDKK